MLPSIDPTRLAALPPDLRKLVDAQQTMLLKQRAALDAERAALDVERARRA